MGGMGGGMGGGGGGGGSSSGGGMGQRQDNQLKQQLAQFWQDQKQDIEALCRDEKKSALCVPLCVWAVLCPSPRGVHPFPKHHPVREVVGGSGSVECARRGIGWLRAAPNVGETGVGATHEGGCRVHEPRSTLFPRSYIATLSLARAPLTSSSPPDYVCVCVCVVCEHAAPGLFSRCLA